MRFNYLKLIYCSVFSHRPSELMLQGVTVYSDDGASSGIAQNMQLKKRVDELKSVTMTTAGNS